MVRVICLTGMPGCGKEEFVRVAQDLSLPIVRMGDVVREREVRRPEHVQGPGRQVRPLVGMTSSEGPSRARKTPRLVTHRYPPLDGGFPAVRATRWVGGSGVSCGSSALRRPRSRLALAAAWYPWSVRVTVIDRPNPRGFRLMRRRDRRTRRPRSHVLRPRDATRQSSGTSMGRFSASRALRSMTMGLSSLTGVRRMTPPNGRADHHTCLEHVTF
jgi:hypothetical protein